MSQINASSLKASFIRWDGNVQENVIFGWEGSGLYTRYAYRQFIRPDGTAYWYTADPALTTDAEAQANVDGEIQWGYQNLVDVWVFDWYPGRVASFNGSNYTLITTVGATLDNAGTPATRVHVDKTAQPTLTLGGTYAGLAAYQFRCKTGGARGTAVFEVSNNDGSSFVVGDITSNASPQAIAGTSATLGFASGTYTVGAVYRTIPYWSKIDEVFKKFKSSKLIARTKFALLLLRNICAFPFEEDPYANFTNLVAYWVALFQDPSYDKIGTSPVVYLYAGSSNAGEQWDQTRILELQTAVTGAGMGAPYFVFINCPLLTIQGHQAAGVVNCSRTSYGGPQKAGPPGHNDWQTQVDLDVSGFAAHSASVKGAPHLVVCNDPRPRMEAGLSYDQWTDEPDYSELESHYQRAINWANTNPTKHIGRMPLYAGPEVGEGGPALPTAQNQDKVFAAWKATASRQYPSTYSDHYTTECLHFTTSGTWTNVQDITGAWNKQEIQSSTTNDYIEIVSDAGIDGTVTNWPAPLTTGFRVYGNVNGVRHTLIHETTGLTAGTYTIRCRVASASSVEILRGGVSQGMVSLGSVSQVGIDDVEFIRARTATTATASIILEPATKTAVVDAVGNLFAGGSAILVRDGTTNLASFALDFSAAVSGAATVASTPLTSATSNSGTADNVLFQNASAATIIDCGVNEGTSNYDVAALNAILNGIAARVDLATGAGKIRLRAGSSTLVDITLSTTAFAAASGGSMLVSGSPSGTATGAGTPDNAQILDGDGNLVFAYSVSGVGAIAVGNLVSATTITLSAPPTGTGRLTLGAPGYVAPANMTIPSGVLQAA